MKKINKYVAILMCIPITLIGLNSPVWLSRLRVFLLGMQVWALVNYAYQEIKGEKK